MVKPTDAVAAVVKNLRRLMSDPGFMLKCLTKEEMNTGC
jgi:hypothetical protein